MKTLVTINAGRYSVAWFSWVIIKTTLAEHNYWCSVYDIGCQQHLMKTLMNLHLYFEKLCNKYGRCYQNCFITIICGIRYIFDIWCILYITYFKAILTHRWIISMTINKWTFSLMKYKTIWHHFVTCAITRVIFICNKDAKILNSRCNYYFLEWNCQLEYLGH